MESISIVRATSAKVSDMRIELKRNSLIIVPETDQDKAFLEDSIGLKTDGDKVDIRRVAEVKMGFKNDGEFVLKVGA